MKTKSRGFLVILLVVFVIIAGAAFPFYNWNKHYSYTLTGITLWLNIASHMIATLIISTFSYILSKPANQVANE